MKTFISSIFLFLPFFIFAQIDTLKAVSCCGYRFEVTDSANRIYFESANYLWTTDGTKTGTKRLSSSIRANHLLLPIGEDFLLGGGSSIFNSFSLYKGDINGVEKIKSVSFRSVGNGPNYARVGDKLVFNGSDDDGKELWVTDGSESGTFQLKDINPGSSSGDPITFKTIGNTAYFRCVVSNEGTSGVHFEIWKTDGTVSGTESIFIPKEKEVFYLNASPAVINNKLYIPIEDLGEDLGDSDNEFVLYSHTFGAFGGNEVYRSTKEFKVFTIGDTMFRRETDSETGTSEVFIWNGATFSLFPGEPKFEMSGEVYYISSATVNTPPHVLYKMGTTGPILLKELPFKFGTFNQLVQKDSKTYFFVEDMAGMYELWETDGTPIGTQKLTSIHADYLNNAALIKGNKIVFRAGLNNRYSILCYTINESNNTCNEDLVLTGQISGLQEASSTIITENETTISSEGSIFKAGHSITLTAGFQALGTGPFEVIIEDCSDNSQAKPSFLTSHQSKKNSPFLDLPLVNQPIPQMIIYPNPFSHQTLIDYQLPEVTPLQISIYSPTGQLIKVVKEEQLAAQGEYRLWLDATDLPTGLYLLFLKTANTLLTQKLIVKG